MASLVCSRAGAPISCGFTRMNPPPGSSRVFEIGSEFFQMPAGFLSEKFRAGFGLIARAARPVHAGGFQ